jgi:hypothetical protein
MGLLMAIGAIDIPPVSAKQVKVCELSGKRCLKVTLPKKGCITLMGYRICKR